jgi:hypothetical protein
MSRYARKNFPVSNIRRFLEPGPIALVSSACKGRINIMTLGWHMVLRLPGQRDRGGSRTYRNASMCRHSL